MLDKHLIAKIRPLADPANIVFFGDFRVTVLSDRLFRIEHDAGRIFCDEATEAVWFRDMPPVPFTAEEDGDVLRVKTEKAELVLCEELEKSHVILGGRKIPLDNEENLRGTYCTLDNCEGGNNIDWQGKRPPQPIELDMGVASKNGVAVLDYTKSSVLLENGMVVKDRRDDLDIYVFAYGHDYRAAVRAFYMICGNTPKLPRYALGNWWSRYYAYTEQKYLNLLDRMEERGVPITVATVDMDWHWNTQNIEEKPGIDAKMPMSERTGKNREYYGGYSGWTGYSWNTNLFPDYKRFLKKLHERGCAVTLNLHPADGVRWFEDMYAEMAREMGMDPETEKRVSLDFTDDKWINAYFKVLHKPYEHDGVDFWWIDWQQGPRAKAAGIDIMWVLNHYHTLDNGKEKTPLILSRYSGLGAHRYPLGFSGDTHATWKTLEYLPYFTATASNIGFTWWSHDIGGHMRGNNDSELYTRFVQYGVFSPINRLHCTSAEYCTKEPMAQMGGAGLIAEEFMRLRHALIPYIYSAMLDTNEKGKALIEPMYYDYPEKGAAYEAKNQYMFGTELLVAPVTSPGDEKGLARTKVWLPEGKWTDIFTGDVYEGGRWVDTVRFMESIPVFAKAGAIVPLDARKNTNSIAEPDKLKVMVFNGNGAYTLREDGGETRFASKAEEGKQTLAFVADEGTVGRRVTLEFRNVQDGEVTVLAGGAPIDADVRADDFVSVSFDVVPGTEYTAEVAYKYDAREYRNNRLAWALTRISLQMSNKDRIWRCIHLDDKELMRTVMTAEYLTENEKIRLTEGW